MKYTHQEWLDELERRFGPAASLNWAFQCPCCGKITTLREFKEAGARPNDSFQVCIGRITGKGVSGMKFKRGDIARDGCDWAAYGLFGTLGKGDIVIAKDGEEVQVFAMAPAPQETE